MKRPANRTTQELNLPLNDGQAAVAVPGGKQKDLTTALMELLINAARESTKRGEDGGEHESEVDR
jgi:hypothetical protein